MSHRHIDKISSLPSSSPCLSPCCLCTESRLTQNFSKCPVCFASFDAEEVHSIELFLTDEDWTSILENPKEKYVHATVIIDGEKFLMSASA